MKIEKERRYNHDPGLIIDGENARETILKCIREATENIHIRMYMWRDDDVGKLILGALEETIRVHPHIQILIEKDAFGTRVYNFQNYISFGRIGGDIFSSNVGKAFLKNTKNIHFSSIGSKSLLFLKYLRENDHSKVFLFDVFTKKSRALIGGMNIANEYLSAQNLSMPDLGGWHDYMVEFRGDLADNIGVNNGGNPQKWIVRKILAGVEIFFTIKNRLSIRKGILAELSRATSFITIEHGYLTDRTIIRKLRRMSCNGIKVQVIIPDRSDGVRHANMASIHKLLKPSIIRKKGKNMLQVFLYPGMIHAKVILIDRSIAIIGSANLTYGSFDFLQETNVIFRKKSPVVTDLRMQLEKDITLSDLITFETIPTYNKFLAWFQRFFI